MLCSPSQEWLNFVSLVHSGLWLGLQWQWSAGPGEQWEPADTVQSGSAAQRLCAPGMPNVEVKVHSCCQLLLEPSLWNIISAFRFH